ncbi:MAG: hypothetical protein QOI04_2193 [Verrucomicrobiota bacterium]|jgi:hypothetical protein
MSPAITSSHFSINPGLLKDLGYFEPVERISLKMLYVEGVVHSAGIV